MKKYLRIIVILILFLSYFESYSTPDSLIVTLCVEESADCFGYDHYSKSVEHFDSLRNKTEINTYIFSGCQHVLDTAIIHTADNYYTYDSSNRLIGSSTINYQGVDSFVAKAIYTRNITGDITSTLNQVGSPGNLINSSMDTIGFNSNGNKLFELSFLWNDTSSSWDTLIIENDLFDSLNRNIQIDYYNLHQDFEIHHYYVYDSDSNLINLVNSSLSAGVFDSNRVVNTYDTLHHRIEYFTQLWDTLQQVWKNFYRQTFNYDSSGLLNTSYNYDCGFDSLCSEIDRKSVYSYDSLGRLVERNDSIAKSGYYIWGGYVYTYRNSDDLIYDEGYSYVIEQGCDYTDYFEYTYNNSKQLVHMHRGYITCDYLFTDCYYFSLGNDSMLVDVYYPFNVCQGDTIYPIVSVEGGVPPYNFQWFPSNDILEASSITPRIVADTTKEYLFLVIDSAGLTKFFNFTLNVTCFPTLTEELKSNETSFNLFPNPFSTETTIKLDEQYSEVTCLIYAMSGKVVRTNNISNGTIVIEKENLTPGIYFVSLFTKDKFIGNRKLIVE